MLGRGLQSGAAPLHGLAGSAASLGTTQKHAQRLWTYLVYWIQTQIDRFELFSVELGGLIVGGPRKVARSMMWPGR